MALFQLTSSYPILFHVKFKHTSNYRINARQKHSVKAFNSSSTTHKIHPLSCQLSQPISSLDSIKPYVQSEWKQILKGWLCSAVSVYSLSKIVPRIGKFSKGMNIVNAVWLREEGLAIGVLFLVRFVANYLQEAFLWDAAMNSVYKVRVHVFERVLLRDLGFFEGGNGVSSGDIAYRITAEASDVADTIYAILNVRIPLSEECNFY